MAVPKEVWAAAKALWESTANITYQEVVDHLQEVYGDKAPASKSAVYNLAKKYGWQKLSMLELKERSENAEKKQNKSEQNGGGKKLENKENNKVKNQHETQIYRTIIDSTDRTKQKTLQEIKRLKRQLKVAEEEREILKKATAYFAKHS